jgi:hypothetical protein
MWAFIFAVPSGMRKCTETVVHVHLYCASGIYTFVLWQWYMYVCIVTTVRKKKSLKCSVELLITSTHFTCRLSSTLNELFQSSLGQCSPCF